MSNALYEIIKVAKLNHIIWLSVNNTKASDKIDELNNYLLTPINNQAKVIYDDKIGYKSIELSAIAKFFENILKSKDEKIVFENTLAYSLHGIDAITKNNKDEYTIYEIKGTTKPIKSAKSYLKKTKTKGKQLSLKWCWYSLIDLVEIPPASKVFLELYRDFINQKVKRKLVIVECEKLKDSSFFGKKVYNFDFNELSIIDNYDLSKQREMLEELDLTD